jgi:outer membrane protein
MIRTVLTLVVVVTCAQNVAAQQPEGMPLTVDAAAQRAIQYSQRLAEARARAEGATAAVESSRSGDKPSVELSTGYRRMNYVQEFSIVQPNGALRVIYPNIPDNYFVRVTMEWPIYTAGHTGALTRAAEAESRAVAAEIEVTRSDLRLEVARTYWALVTAAETVRVLQEGVVRADAHLRDVRSRFENGLVPPNDVSTVEAQRAREEMLLIEARNHQESIAEDLRRLTGITGPIVPAEPLASTMTVVAEEEAKRAEIEALEQRIDAAEQRASAIEAAGRPSVDLSATADYANPNLRQFPLEERWQSSWQVGVTGRWMLWDGGRIQSEAAQASAEARALRARQADVAATINSEVRQRRLDLDSARAALAAAGVAVTSAADARRVVNERFGVGVATNTELLDAHVALLQAELDRTRALANIRLAEARLQRALGR